jgi:hypothetical protein
MAPKSHDDPPSFPLSDLFDRQVPVAAWLKKIIVPNMLAQKKAFTETKFCSTPGCESKKFQWCHVVPSSAQLSQIADKGEVCWIPLREEDRFTMNSYWTQDPISKTLVFRGFCNSCDSSLFEKIDETLNLTAEIFTLLAYRAASYSNWRAEVDLRNLELTPGMVREMVSADSSLPPLKEGFESFYEKQIDDSKRHRNDTKSLMSGLRNEIDAENFDYLETRVFDFGRRLPFRYSVAASFTTSLRHEHVNVSKSECGPTPSLYLHMLDSGSTTKLIMSWPKYVPQRIPDTWLTQLIQYSDSGHLADVLLRYMFIHNHGLVFSPSFVPSLDHEQASFLTAPLATSFYHGQKPGITRICEPPYFASDWKLKAWQKTN